MQIIVLADELQRESLLQKESSEANVIWINHVEEFLAYKGADVFVDLGFKNEENRKSLLRSLFPKLVIINSVSSTLEETDTSFIRINGWNSFLSSAVLEAACGNDADKKRAEEVFSHLNKRLEWCSDDIGFITARVVSMIINEAYLALAEGVSSKDEMNIAMKLGTAYPYGPFEWAEKIGIRNITELLQKLSQLQPRYTPASVLSNETN